MTVVPYSKVAELPPAFKNLTSAQKQQGLRMLNALLSEGMEEGKAIRITLAKVQQASEGGEKVKGRFLCRAEVVVPPGQDPSSMFFQAVVATSNLVDGNKGRSRITPEAIAMMRTVGEIPLSVGKHEDAVVDPSLIVGKGTPVMDAEDGMYVLNCELDPDDVRSRPLYNKIVSHPEWIKTSIGGFIPPGGAERVISFDEAEGRSVIFNQINQLEPDHGLLCRAASAVDPACAVSAEGRAESDFSSAVFRAASELLENEPEIDLEVVDGLEGRAKWTRKHINDLPDSDFLFIEPGGEKDGEGKTVPRELRHLPVKENGAWDCPHLSNAAARADQIVLADGSKISEGKGQELKNKAMSLYQEHCVSEGRCDDLPDEEVITVERTDAVENDEAMSMLRNIARGLGRLFGLADGEGAAVEGEPQQEVSEMVEQTQTEAETSDTPEEAEAPSMEERMALIEEKLDRITGHLEKLASPPEEPVEERTEEVVEEEESEAEEETVVEQTEEPAQEEVVEASEEAEESVEVEERTEESEEEVLLHRWFQAVADVAAAVKGIEDRLTAMEEKVETVSRSRGVSVQATNTISNENKSAGTSKAGGVRTIFRDMTAGLKRP